MFINAVLQNYKEIKRPEGIFDISNIQSSYLIPGNSIYSTDGEVSLYRKTMFCDDKLFKYTVNQNIKPPFVNTWYEYKWRENARGILVYDFGNGLEINTFIYEKSKNLSQILDKIILNTHDYLLGNAFADYYSFRDKEEIEKTKKENTDEELKLYLQAFILPALLVNALLHCKNIQTQHHEFPNRRPIAHYKRIGKPYFEKYYTLQVKPFYKYKNESSGEASGWSNAFHIYRGHFKTYTKEKPLFGKYTGVYWWESSVRGSKDVGIINKDYKVVV